jgi:4,5-dihydroxyphthalate decarboxylase
MLRLTLAAGHYDRTEALRDGRVRAEGIDLTYIMLRVEEIFWRMAQHREFDASEFSLGGYVVRRGRGADDLVAIPVFPSRFFGSRASSSMKARAFAARRTFVASASAYPSTR